ncbi:hypothetical protein [Hasllibacter sp. MH4015]|uniref:hypothetical protein n=1 Tax=Hasllibacter sp. MH4015 TaxID=2854029 RepID=UPI001CD43FF6|nr:hypothetical protein [Hasllibacter sp. MH4015]
MTKMIHAFRPAIGSNRYHARVVMECGAPVAAIWADLAGVVFDAALHPSDAATRAALEEMARALRGAGASPRTYFALHGVLDEMLNDVTAEVPDMRAGLQSGLDQALTTMMRAAHGLQPAPQAEAA